MYFVDFFHPKRDSKDTDDHRLNTIVELPIEQTSLNIYIASKFIRLRDNVQPSMTDVKRLSLEGDFGSFYNVYCPEGEHVDALVMLEPNLMLAILQNLGNVAIEIKKNKLFIVIPGFVKDPETLIRLINNCRPVTEQINHTVKNMNSQDRHDVEADQSYQDIKQGIPLKLVLTVFFSVLSVIALFIAISNVASDNAVAVLTFSILPIISLLILFLKLKSTAAKRKYIKKYGKNGIY